MGAPKGNLYALGNNGGRPPKYDDPKELEAKIEEYFDYIQGEEGEETYINDQGIEVFKWKREPERPTVTGLALFIGFSHKGTLYEYAKKEEFKDSIKRALSLVERSYEFMLDSKTYGGAIFALKNMGWKDKVEQEHSFPSGNVTIQSEGKRPETD